MITPQFWNLEISSQTSSFIAVISKTKQSGLKCCQMVPLSRLDFKAVLVGYNSTTTATFNTHWPLNSLDLSMAILKKNILTL